MENGDPAAPRAAGLDPTADTRAGQAAYDAPRGADVAAAASGGEATIQPRSGREAILRVPMTVRIVLGSIHMSVSELMSLKRGSVIPLDRGVGEPVDIVVNNQLIARGEVIVVDEEGPTFAVSVVDVVQEPTKG